MKSNPFYKCDFIHFVSIRHLVILLLINYFYSISSVIGDYAPSVGDGYRNDDSSNQDSYLIGVGMADVTGPAAEVNMMGYAKFGQDTGGIHYRLYSRAFIFEDQSGHRAVFVSVDVCMIDQAIKTQVAKLLEERYGDLYRIDNVMLSGTHTHSGPGGFLQYLLYTITGQGFNWQNFNAIVDGIIRSIDRAHNSMRKGYIYYNQGILLNASINRSPTAYLNNSAEERAKYKYDTDKEMHMLKLVDTSNQPLGLITWFAVHPTSMNNTNHLISGDNKGYASYLFEQSMNKGKLPGRGPFVAAFAASNLGDVSPNLKGPHCADTGKPCDILTSTCGGKNANCFAIGPGKDMFESTKIIGERQYIKAKELFVSATERVSGEISFVHQYKDMTQVDITLPSGEVVHTCKPAMGYSFAAGTTDGPGAFDFRQGTTSPNAFWNLVRDFISKPSQKMIECHKPKPILLSTGQMNFPYPWQPHIVPTQLMAIGNVIIIGAPAEFTTMSGRRIREAVKSVYDNLRQNIISRTMENESKCHVILAGLANAYSSYVATHEEYQVQRYEGASTIFGPYTQLAYQLQYVDLAKSLVIGKRPNPGPDPPNLLSKQISLRPGVIFDTAQPGKSFGECILQPNEEYKAGSTVMVKFISGHPRNDLMTEATFLTVERYNARNSSYQVIATDSDPETKFIWKRTNSLLGWSEATIVWDIPSTAVQGFYRLRHFGAHKNFLQQIRSYSGQSNLFKVINSK